ILQNSPLQELGEQFDLRFPIYDTCLRWHKFTIWLTV
ncbi:unnamed protein product, partial [marine sediment metagenome]